jgi:hypothetical protein
MGKGQNSKYEYLEVMGHPKNLSSLQIHARIIAFERAIEYFSELFLQAEIDSDEEQYLSTRLREMSSFMVLCQDEISSRTQKIISLNS